ncbi:MAG: hypothetical protein QXU75_09555 [Candidatus Methanomethylicaceae archaeon]
MEEICQNCDGVGFVEHPAWREFRNSVDPAQWLWASESDIKGWFAWRGFDEVPQEELICEKCGGKGIIEE